MCSLTSTLFAGSQRGGAVFVLLYRCLQRSSRGPPRCEERAKAQLMFIFSPFIVCDIWPSFWHECLARVFFSNNENVLFFKTLDCFSSKIT